MTILAQHHTGQHLHHRLGHTFAGVIEWFEMNSAKGRAARDANRLLALSDRDLRDIGLTREQVVQRAFSDKGYY